MPLLEQVVAETPDRLPALEALAVVRERQGRVADAIALRQKIYGMRTPTPAELVRLGELAMGARQTDLALESFEKARGREGPSFARDLELGVLYLAARRFEEARDALDRVPPTHPAYPMALFKRAQVSVLLHEPDQAARIERARRRADATTRPLIASERLFQGVPVAESGEGQVPLTNEGGHGPPERCAGGHPGPPHPPERQNWKRAASWNRRGSK